MNPTVTDPPEPPPVVLDPPPSALDLVASPGVLEPSPWVLVPAGVLAPAGVLVPSPAPEPFEEQPTSSWASAARAEPAVRNVRRA
jgi:hypothetical protein